MDVALNLIRPLFYRAAYKSDNLDLVSRGQTDKTMKAAVLHEIGSQLSVEDVPVPKVTPGCVLVKVLAAGVVHYAEDVYNGKLAYPMTLPLIPGANGIGIVEEIGPDTTEIKQGDLVFCDPTIRARDNAIGPMTILQGLFTPAGSLTSTYKNGAMAEKNARPAGECCRFAQRMGEECSSLGLSEPALCPGQTLLMLGATGSFGSPAVQIALAMGARRIVIPGRNKQKLDELVQKVGDSRVVSVLLQESEDANVAAFKEAAKGEIDCALDLLEPNTPMSIIRSALLSLRGFGTLVLMSGRRDSLDVPFFPIMTNNLQIKGCFVYARAARHRLINMIEAGLINLNHFQVTGTFSLDQVNEAIRFSKEHRGPFNLTVVTPNRL
ncbi:hypothetical protein BZG36_03017 [Bifiguratus adelaidae]|uniref:Enoyl reductase (ER) domain-containing protein n=1 Tax=Bifiguratus adelaidae TaxID=1938954 RepID=A0A261XZL3_9FUNG|nr:hypothetical protein BZG36_03017 [Bifiguratus adelaidae]